MIVWINGAFGAGETTTARRWRQNHVTRASTTFASLTDALFVDASQPPDRVAEAVA